MRSSPAGRPKRWRTRPCPSAVGPPFPAIEIRLRPARPAGDQASRPVAPGRHDHDCELIQCFRRSSNRGSPCRRPSLSPKCENLPEAMARKTGSGPRYGFDPCGLLLERRPSPWTYFCSPRNALTWASTGFTSACSSSMRSRRSARPS
jgi:hypothetical protein